MKDTVITLSAEQASRAAYGYDETLRPVRMWDYDALAGAGAIRSTVDDLPTFCTAQIELSDSPLKPAMRRMRSFRPPTGLPDQEQAMGWEIFTKYGQDMLFHSGGTHGFHAAIAVQRDAQRAVVLLANSLVPVADIAKYVLDPRYSLAVQK